MYEGIIIKIVGIIVIVQESLRMNDGGGVETVSKNSIEINLLPFEEVIKLVTLEKKMEIREDLSIFFLPLCT